MRAYASLVAVTALLVACSSPSEPAPQQQPPVTDCRCTGEVAEGAIDIACGESLCVGGVTYTCADKVATPGEPCESPDAGVDSGDAGPTCKHKCAIGEISCQYGYLHSCTTNEKGCRVWDSGTQCPSKFCGSTTACGVCSSVCTVGSTECTDGRVRTCGTDYNGCPAWQSYSYCPERACADATACGKCDAACLAARVPRIDAGRMHTCLIQLDGTVKCWGAGKTASDCTGTGSECGQSAPPGGIFKSVSSGAWSTCGLSESGTATCWGASSNNRTAVPVDGYRSIAMSYWHGCAVKSGGALTCWGDYFTNTPPTGTNFTEVGGGENHNCALRSDGTLACWPYAKLLFASHNSRVIPPTGSLKQLAVGRRHNCAVRTDGTVACWGMGERADACTDTAGDCGQSIPPSGTFKQVTAGTYHSCGLKLDGTVVCWGRPPMTQVPNARFVDISAGEWHTCGITTDGGVACWGVTGTLGAANPACAPSPCTTAGQTQCVGYSDGTSKCLCDAGMVEVAGKCVDATPCDPNPCTTPNRNVCTDVSYTAVCSCNAGYAEDTSGVCRDSTPCSPNPCTTAGRTVCNASGFDYTCACDPGLTDLGTKCVRGCTGGYHTDGDSLEPNECSDQATPLTATPAGSSPTSTSATIAPLSTDVDFFRLARSSSHAYWTLLASDAMMCNGGISTDPLIPTVGGTWTYVAQLNGGPDSVFSCARVSGQPTNPSYALGAIDFDLSAGDYPGSSSSPRVVPGRSMTDTLPMGDTDRFKFAAALPVTISSQGQGWWLDVIVRDPSTGTEVASTSTICNQSLSPRACVSLTGSGTADVEVTVSYAPDWASSTPTLTAYHLSW